MKIALKLKVIVWTITNLGFVTFGATPREIAQNAFPAVVLIVMQDKHGQPLSQGSGFFVKDDVIASNYHVVKGAAGGYGKLVGKRDKFELEGVVALDIANDIVLLKVRHSSVIPLPVGESKDVQIGDEVFAIGNPMGLEGTMSHGIVSGIRSIKEHKLLQITAPISPGSSGGPVLNLKGEVIGISVATFKDGQNLNFAVPADYLSQALKSQSNLCIFSSIQTNMQSKAIIDSFTGGKNLDGIKIKNFATDDGGYGFYSFIIKNDLDKAVNHIRWRVIYYDSAGEPIDYCEAEYADTIEAHLAKSIPWTLGGSVRGKFSRCELRVLDFRIGTE
jgi:hypothetical protein